MERLLLIRECEIADERGSNPGLSDVAIKDSRIVEIAPSGSIRFDGDAQQYEAHGGTLVPGLVNMHEHLGNAHPGTLEERAIVDEGDVGRTLRMAGNAMKALRVGVTTMRLVGEKGGFDLRIRDAIERGEIDGPRLFTAGAPLDFPGGHGGSVGALESESAEGYREFAQTLIDSGVDHLKLMICGGGAGRDLDNVRMPLEHFETIRAVARAAGRKMALHTAAIEHPIMDLVIDDGLDSLEHCYRLPQNLLKRCVEQEILLVMTPLVGRSRDYFETIELPGDMVQNLSDTGTEHWPVIQSAVKAGARLALGTDFHSHLEFDGTSAPVRELEAYEEAGVTGQELLALASRNGARWLGLDQELGLVEEGFLADLLVLESNPISEGASAFRDIRHVIARGRLFEARPPETPIGS